MIDPVTRKIGSGTPASPEHSATTPQERSEKKFDRHDDQESL